MSIKRENIFGDSLRGNDIRRKERKRTFKRTTKSNGAHTKDATSKNSNIEKCKSEHKNTITETGRYRDLTLSLSSRKRPRIKKDNARDCRNCVEDKTKTSDGRVT